MLPHEADAPGKIAQRGTLAVIASSPGLDDHGSVTRARALARVWPGPVRLILTTRPTQTVSPEALPEEVALVAADEAIEKELATGQDEHTRRLAMQSLLSAGDSGQRKIERIYLFGDLATAELLPLLAPGDEATGIDFEVEPSAQIPDSEALWPFVDTLIASDPALAYPLAALQPALPVRIVPRGDSRDVTRALRTLPGLGGRPCVSVVMPVRGGEDIAVRSVAAVLARTPELREIVLIDDASPDGTLDRLGRIAHKDARVRLLVNERQQGFAATSNRGFAVARGETVVLLGADTVVTPGWSTHLLSHLERHPRIGAVAPCVNRGPRLQRVSSINYDEESLAGLEEFSRRFLESRPRNATPLTQLSGICLAIPRRALRLVGGFDPRFFPGGFEDEDWSARLLAGRLIPCRAEEVFIHHEGAGSLAFEEQSPTEIHARGWRIFKEKWGLADAWPLERGYRVEDLHLGAYSRARHFIPPWKASEGVAR